MLSGVGRSGIYGTLHGVRFNGLAASLGANESLRREGDESPGYHQLIGSFCSRKDFREGERCLYGSGDGEVREKGISPRECLLDTCKLTLVALLG